MAIKLGKPIRDLIRVVSPSEQIIKPRLDRFLLEHGNDPFDPPIAAWVAEQLTAVPRNRTRSFAGSASGSCTRAQIFQYLGMPVPPTDVDAQLQQIFNDGKFRHIRLQAQMMQAGIIELGAMEYPLPWPEKRSMGTADGNGIVPMDHIHTSWRGLSFGLEIKGASTWIAKVMKEPDKYMPQVHRYFLAGGFDLFVIYVEDKNTQESREWVIEPDPNWLEMSREELDELNRHVDEKTLPNKLPACVDKSGPLYKKCPYGGKDTRPCARLPIGSAPELYDAVLGMPKMKKSRQKPSARGNAA